MNDVLQLAGAVFAVVFVCYHMSRWLFKGAQEVVDVNAVINKQMPEVIAFIQLMYEQAKKAKGFTLIFTPTVGLKLEREMHTKFGRGVVSEEHRLLMDYVDVKHLPAVTKGYYKKRQMQSALKLLASYDPETEAVVMVMLPGLPLKTHVISLYPKDAPKAVTDTESKKDK
jgi:hypothetical protein